jgi:hypothetical protein
LNLEFVTAFEKIGAEMERFHGQHHHLDVRRMRELRANGEEETELIDHLSNALQEQGLEFLPKNLESFVRGTQGSLCTRALVHNVLRESGPIVVVPLLERFLRKYAAIVSGRAFERKITFEA